MKVIAKTILALCGLLAAAACSITDQSHPVLDAEIRRVITGLHERRSVASVPSEEWTLEQRLAHYRVPAVSIAVIHDGEIHWARAFGKATAGDDQWVNEETVFQAASISKALTAFATLRLVDKGLLALDTPVNKYLRSWRLPDSDAGSSDSVTVARVMAHMAGLNVAGFPGYAVNVAIPTVLQILDGVAPANTPPIRIVGRPGANWAYSGGGYLLLQQVLLDVTGQGFAILMEDLVLIPVGMEHSTFQQALSGNLEANAAVGHYSDGRAVAGRWHIYPELAAAGLWTTASDLARFALAIRATAGGSPQALLTSQNTGELTTPQFGNFSLGLLIRCNGEHAWFTCNGGNEGYRALMYAYLTDGEGAVVMTNSDDGMGLAIEIVNSIALEYRWPGFIPEELQ